MLMEDVFYREESYMNPMSLEGKNIIITGAASGIGRETAILASALGANLLLFDLNDEDLEKTAEACKGETIGIACDVTRTEILKEHIIKIKQEIGKFHGLVHCAGVASVIPIRSLSSSEYERVQRVNTQAGLELAKIFSDRRVFDKESSCSIVFISSVYGLVGSACNAAYAISKAAIIGMTKALAVEFASKKIRVNCIAPGFIKTTMADHVENKFDENYEDKIQEMHLLGWGEAIDIANGIVFLLSNASKWTTGAVFNIDGGFTAQ
ncbi:MAG: SDR family oxidoreductase [Bacteroidales bacterium]|nr:SDR family oxidoreductase [Clostridium sp.]MCM1203854.1 SDR family oxidoreductase [Bacteroidales bacterium]